VTLIAILLAFALMAAVVLIVTRPLRDGPRAAGAADAPGRAALEAAKEAKYREIRDNELDHRTGKLSDDDFRALDRQLRGEAVELLRQLDELG
jgi:hypothetical protein